MPTSTKKKCFKNPFPLRDILDQCQCQCTVPAANRASPKSALEDDYYGENNRGRPKVLLPQAIALLFQGSSRALTTSSFNQIAFLFLSCSILKDFLIHFSDLTPERQQRGMSISKDPFRMFLVKRKTSTSAIWTFYAKNSGLFCFSPRPVKENDFRITGYLAGLHKLDGVPRISQNCLGPCCLVDSPEAKLVIPGPQRHWVGSKKKFYGETAWTHG